MEHNRVIIVGTIPYNKNTSSRAFDAYFHNWEKKNIPRFIKECYFRMSLPIIITILFGTLLNKIFMPKGWFDLMFRGVLVIIVFSLLLYTLGINCEDREKIKQFIQRRG